MSYCILSFCGGGIRGLNLHATKTAHSLLLLALLGGGCMEPTPPETGDTGTTAAMDSEDTADTAVDTTGTDTTGTDTTGPEPLCGNGVVEPGEDCDDAGESAMCDADCTEVACGDSTLNAAAGEGCDGDELGDATCESQGFDVGTLWCGADCALDTSECYLLPAEPVLMLSFSAIKWFDFSWAAVAEADYYQLLESAVPGEPFVQLGGDIMGESVSRQMPLHLRHDASYLLRACNEGGCTDSAAVEVMSSLAEAVGYFKASNASVPDEFGNHVALSGDGRTLAVSAPNEASGATGIGGDQADNSASFAGAVYVFTHDGMGAWSQQAYVKASNTDQNDQFGNSVALSADGDTLAVGAPAEDSSATGIDGDQADNSAGNAGAVYVFTRDGVGTWSQQAYVKASNTDQNNQFGTNVALSADGDTLAVGVEGEDSSATGIDGNQADNSAPASGAVYVLTRDGVGTWSQQAYIKASNTSAGDLFGRSVALSGDGTTLAVGADGEDSSATGIDGNQADDTASFSGAAYVFTRDGMGTWSQQAYVKASNTDANDYFGRSVALGGDGDTLVVGAIAEASAATGIDGDQADNSVFVSGAVYVLTRDDMGTWSQQAYVKASNTDASDQFGLVVALSGDGDTLAVGTGGEASGATGIGGDQADNSTSFAGAVYVLARDGAGTWSHRAYVKASNTGENDSFGSHDVALSGDGTTLAVGAEGEDSSAAGIGGDQADDSAPSAGAVYVY